MHAESSTHDKDGTETPALSHISTQQNSHGKHLFVVFSQTQSRSNFLSKVKWRK